MSYCEVKGDLFAVPPSTSLAHCVSKDLKMGKGIATIFKRKFGGVDDLRKQQVDIGCVGELKRGSRLVFYLVTKQYYYNKPTYQSLRNSLSSLAAHVRSKNDPEFTLAMPKIGCGLDGLSWVEVKQIIQEELPDVHVTIYYI